MKAGWGTVGLAELEADNAVQLGRGKVISKKDLAASPGAYPVYSSAKENDGKFGEYGLYLFDEELITWSVDGGGKLFHRPRHKFSVTNVGGFIRILDPARLDCRFLYYVLSHLHAQVTFDWVKKAHPSVIRQIYNEIPLPPLEEQQRIVAILDEAFEGLARAKANAEANLASAKELFQSAAGAILKPEACEWPCYELAALVEDDCKLSYGIVQPGDEVPGGLPIVRPTDLGPATVTMEGLKRIDPRLADGYSRTVLKGEDILLCVRGTTGTVSTASPALAGGNVTRGIVPIRFHPKTLDQRLGCYLMQSRDVQDQIAARTYGAALRQINIKDVRKLELPVPPFDDQRELVLRLDDLAATTEKLLTAYIAQVSNVQNLRQSLLAKAFAGELS